MEIACEACEHFFSFPEYNNEMGQCRMKSPSMVPMQQPDMHDDDFKAMFNKGGWPEVDHKAWCGRFKECGEIKHDALEHADLDEL
ncbi:MAG: hypothetical protein HKK66_08340 [Chlorobiaceae bacterium]|nr:hypothetical protein [Chlorobiaceae bacterium]